MKFHTRVPWLTAALAAALLAGAATAADSKDKDAPAKLDKDAEAWINVLAAKIADRHDSIRESSRLALIAIGKPALPALQKLANGDDGAAAEAAHHVITRIEQGRDGQFGPHGFPGAIWPHRPGGPGQRDGFGPPAGGSRGPGGPPPRSPRSTPTASPPPAARPRRASRPCVRTTPARRRYQSARRRATLWRRLYQAGPAKGRSRRPRGRRRRLWSGSGRPPPQADGLLPRAPWN